MARDARAKFANLQAFGKVTFATAIPCTCMVGITNYQLQKTGGVTLLIICCWNEPHLPSFPLSGIFFHSQPKSELGTKFSRRGMLRPFLSEANGQDKPFPGGTASQNIIAQALKGILISNSHPYIGHLQFAWWVEVG